MTESYKTTGTGVTYDVCGIGNAIVDILAKVTDDFLNSENMPKGRMNLIEADRAEAIYKKLGQCTECSGGSVANSMAGLASLGARTVYMGRVKDDQLGEIFKHDMEAMGVDFPTLPAQEGKPTARSFICITNDGERTMNTFLGACTEFSPEDIDEQKIAASGIIYIEGYLWDQPKAKEAIRKALKAAKAAGRKVAFTLSDTFCVDRHRDEFRALLPDIDILFANESEAFSLSETTNMGDCEAYMTGKVPLVVITRSEHGALVLKSGTRQEVPAEKVVRVMDVTGAGDLFAAGFLFGLTRGWSMEASARLANRCAAEIIQQIGARSLNPLGRFVA